MFKHGLHLHPLYNIWHGMLKRCYNTASTGYHKYGARGITVCERWHSIENFVADMGERPSQKHSIERIDNEGQYEPNNCCWATNTEQANNRRNSKWITIDGVTRTAKQWADFLGRKDADYIYKRLRMGWNPVDAVMCPVDIHTKYASIAKQKGGEC